MAVGTLLAINQLLGVDWLLQTPVHCLKSELLCKTLLRLGLSLGGLVCTYRLGYSLTTLLTLFGLPSIAGLIFLTIRRIYKLGTNKADIQERNVP